MMNNRGHLPAGQPMQGGADMGPGPGGGGPRRGGRPQHYVAAHHYHQQQQQQQQQQQHVNQQQPMYPAGYMGPYAGAPYYTPPHYQNGAMPAAYMQAPYPPAAYNRSPPPMQHYVPLVPQTYARPPQQSPVVSAPYQAPTPPVAAVLVPPPLTPSSTHSLAAPPLSHPLPHPVVAAAPPMTPPVQQYQQSVPVHVEQPAAPQPQPQHQALTQPPLPATLPRQQPEPQVKLSPSVSPLREPYRPPLPWLSCPGVPFPSRAARSKRPRRMLDADAERVELPHTQHGSSPDISSETTQSTATQVEKVEDQASVTTPRATSSTPTPNNPNRPETPSTPAQPSEDATSTSPTTPSSVNQPQQSIIVAVTPSKPAKSATRSAVPVPALPVIPALPKASPKDSKFPSSAEKTPGDAKPAAVATASSDEQVASFEKPDGEVAEAGEQSSDAVQSAAAPAKPKLWTNLFAKAASTAAATTASAAVQANTNGNVAADGSTAASGAVAGFSMLNVNSVAEALQEFRVGGAEKLAFLEPRGLVNTGNMCYMNSVLQVLIFCVPFFDFLDQVSKRAVHSFKNETPLLDSMIMFMREFKVIDSAVSVEQLRRRLKNEELEEYGEQFTPEFVYDAIRNLPRFSSMRRGHQQDAEEFLGFLLEGLHDECAQVIRAAPNSSASTAPNSSLPSPSTSSRANDTAEGGDDWLEVGPRQRAAVTRSSGYSHTLSPITKIFGGQLRSELRVPGLKNSVTLEPYQPLQLDIGSPEIRNIVDALKGLTRPETIHGDFNSPHGKDARATKQIFIESLPPVLILHLKRFQFDAEGQGGTVKIWKKVGYPLELEIPREILARQKRNTILGENGLPKYQLTAVVYHHGKNASGGHYTVDVRRQDGREWIRIDDTVITRVRSEDVAEGGAEEDAVKASSSEGRREASNTAAANRFVGINDEETGDEEGWKQASASGKKWSSVVNGATPPPTHGSKAKKHKDSIKDNKVAYLLFYQRI